MHMEVVEPVGMLPDSKRRFSNRVRPAFGRANPELNVGRTAEGEFEIVAAASLESLRRKVNAGRHLSEWAERDRRGQGFGATVRFMPPDGSARSPDAAWVSNEALAKLSRREKRSCPHLAPESVVEVRSPRNSLKKAKTKGERRIANGVQLGWLVNGGHETVSVDRRGEPAERGIQRWAGEGPGKRFVSNLRPIWRGLR